LAGLYSLHSSYRHPWQQAFLRRQKMTNAKVLPFPKQKLSDIDKQFTQLEAQRQEILKQAQRILESRT
jgi:hypothetical protein